METLENLTLGEESIALSILKSSRRAQTMHSIIAIRLRTEDALGMGHLVQARGGLIQNTAGVRPRRELGKVGRAGPDTSVGSVRLAVGSHSESVGVNAVDALRSAVVGHDSLVSVRGLRGDLVQDTGDAVAGLGVVGLEEALEQVGRVVRIAADEVRAGLGHLCCLGKCVVDRLLSLRSAVFEGSACVERAGDGACDKGESDEGLEETHFDRRNARKIAKAEKDRSGC